MNASTSASRQAIDCITPEPYPEIVAPEERPILVSADGKLVSAVDVPPTYLSGTNRWRGFAMEILETPASETPPRATLIRHMICTIDSPTPFHLYWRESGRERKKLVAAGDHLIRSQQELCGFHWDSAARALILGIDVPVMDSILRDVMPPGTQLQEFYGAPDDYLHSLMRALASDLIHGSPTGPVLGESLCTAITVHAARRYAVFGADSGKWAGFPGDHRLRTVLDFIDSRLGDQLSLFELAQIAGLSPFYLTRMFKARLHQSVHQYILNQRIERAKRLLCRTALGLSAIAVAVGFRHLSHFSQTFRRLVVVTPHQFRGSC